MHLFKIVKNFVVIELILAKFVAYKTPKKQMKNENQTLEKVVFNIGFVENSTSFFGVHLYKIIDKELGNGATFFLIWFRKAESSCYEASCTGSSGHIKHVFHCNHSRMSFILWKLVFFAF